MRDTGVVGQILVLVIRVVPYYAEILLTAGQFSALLASERDVEREENMAYTRDYQTMSSGSIV